MEAEGERAIVLERWQAGANACRGCVSLDGLLFFKGGGPEPDPPPRGVHYGCSCRRRLVDTSQMSEVRLTRLAREARDNGRRSVALLAEARRLSSEP